MISVTIRQYFAKNNRYELYYASPPYNLYKKSADARRIQLNGGTAEDVLSRIVGGPTSAGCVRARPDGEGVSSAWVGADVKLASASGDVVIQCLLDTGTG